MPLLAPWHLADLKLLAPEPLPQAVGCEGAGVANLLPLGFCPPSPQGTLESPSMYPQGPSFQGAA